MVGKKINNFVWWPSGEFERHELILLFRLNCNRAAKEWTEMWYDDKMNEIDIVSCRVTWTFFFSFMFSVLMWIGKSVLVMIGELAIAQQLIVFSSLCFSHMYLYLPLSSSLSLSMSNGSNASNTLTRELSNRNTKWNNRTVNEIECSSNCNEFRVLTCQRCRDPDRLNHHLNS